MNRNAYALVGATLLCFAVAVARAQQPGKKSQSQTASPSALYRSPSAFAELPGKVALDLERRGCRIPQQAYTRKKTNVIHGEFARPGQIDWAALCSIHGVSPILVYWNGSEQSPAELERFEDRNWLWKDDAGHSQFMRGIGPVGKAYIMEHYRAYGGPTPPPIDHQGIDDYIAEKGSVTLYFYGGKWMKLTGAD